MSLSIVIPLPPEFPCARSHRNPTGVTPKLSGDIRSTSMAPLEDEGSQSGQSGPDSPSSDLTSSSGTSPVTSSPAARVSSRKPSSSSLPIFNRSSPPTPPVVHWCPSPNSPTWSSSTLVGSGQEENGDANAAIDEKIRTHLQTCLDENKLVNRGHTMNSTMSYCATLKGFQDHSSLQLDDSFQQLLTHAMMLDFALEESNYEGLSRIMHGLERGLEEFLVAVEKLPFDLRNTKSFISSTSDMLQVKAALSAVASQLATRADGKSSDRIMKRCLHERDMLLRAIRVFLEVADFESTLQSKLSSKGNPNPAHSPKRKIIFRRPTLTLRQSSRRSKLPDALPASSQSQPEPEAKDAEEDEYDFHVNMVSDIVQLPEPDEYWGVRMPDPVGDAADVFLSEESGSMQGASLSALVYILTDPQPRTPIGGGDLLDTFLLCFRTFCDPIELAKALISRYEAQPVRLNNSQRESWPVYQSSMKARVLRLITTWIDQYWIHERDRIAGLHLKEFISRTDERFAPEERAEIVQKLNERREEAISLALVGDSMDQRQSDSALKSSGRATCRQSPIQYKARLRARVEKLIRSVPQRTPTDDELQSAEALNDLLSSGDGSIHILDLNSYELCRELARQLALFMSGGYLRVIPEDLWYRFGMGHGCGADTARSTQQTYESALSSWVTGSILDQVEAETRTSVLTFFIALALRSHEYHNYSAMRSIYDGLTHPCLESLSEMRLPLSVPARWALDRLSELKENVDWIVDSGRAITEFPRPAVPSMEWYFNDFGNAVNAKPHLVSPNSRRPIANMGRCFNVVRVIRQMEHWHVPYNYPRADHVQAWLLKNLEGAIARDTDKECDWMFKQSKAIEQTGRPEPTKPKLPRLANPFGKKSPKTEWKEATIWGLVPELEPNAKSTNATPTKTSRSGTISILVLKPLPPIPQG